MLKAFQVAFAHIPSHQFTSLVISHHPLIIITGRCSLEVNVVN